MHSKDIAALIQAIDQNTLKIPTQPEVAVRLRDCAQDTNVDSSKLAKIISHDPGLSARFIQIANSPLTRGATEINSLSNVISRLGLTYVRDIATGLAMEQIFQATNETIDKMMYDTWTASTYVAAHAHAYAKHFSKIPVETAALAGLIYQVGVLPILSYAQDHDDLIEDQATFQDVIKNHYGKISEFILTSWKFPKEIADLPSQLHQERIAQEGPSLADIVEAAIIKTQEMKKHFIDTQSSNQEIHLILKLEDPKILATDAFKNDLQESFRFYCQL